MRYTFSTALSIGKLSVKLANNLKWDSRQLTNNVVHGGWIPTMSPGPIKGPSSRDHEVKLDYPVP